MEQAGYFDYGHARFFRDGDVAQGTWRLNVLSSRLLVRSFELVVSEHRWFGKKITVGTQVDVDVLFALLKTFYGLSFA
jgi:hypothetical protein